jgi:hypothetical protein
MLLPLQGAAVADVYPSRVLCMDAVHFEAGARLEQYRQRWLERELAKAYVGFATPVTGKLRHLFSSYFSILELSVGVSTSHRWATAVRISNSIL